MGRCNEYNLVCMYMPREICTLPVKSGSHLSLLQRTDMDSRKTTWLPRNHVVNMSSSGSILTLQEVLDTQNTHRVTYANRPQSLKKHFGAKLRTSSGNEVFVGSTDPLGKPGPAGPPHAQVACHPPPKPPTEPSKRRRRPRLTEGLGAG